MLSQRKKKERSKERRRKGKKNRKDNGDNCRFQTSDVSVKLSYSNTLLFNKKVS